MKKMLDSKFLFILGLSILVLIGLGIGAFYLFDNSDNTFIKSGYVINPLSSKVEKYFFEGETSYRENLSSMIEFKDTEDNSVTILKDSFLHYNDGSMSFLKNGAILDLNSINGKDAVAFYNITNESIIEKNNENYVIQSNTHDIKLKNFVGRINDDKYIVVGNLELRLPGNNTNIKGDYFEIVYADNGVVNIENRELKYQVTAEETYIYAGDILIDLGNKKISKNKEDIMSITAITINGDENIEIIPKVKEEPTTKAPSNGNGGDGNGDGNKGNEQQQTGTINKENSLSVKIKDASVTSSDVTVKFEIENAVVTDNFSLRVTNLETGAIVKKIDSIESGRPYQVSFLNPSTKYLFTIINESDNSKYVQKMYETSPLGVEIEKIYATENKLVYHITADKNTGVTAAKLILKKFDEETGITSNVKDEEGNDRIIPINIAPGKDYEVEFTNLESDSIYTAVLTDFKVPPYNSLGSDDEEDSYRLAVTAMTLKKLPDFGKLTWSKDRTQSTIKLAINDIIDEDKAIRSYTYLVYNYNDQIETNTAIPAIIKNNASPIEIPVDGVNDEHIEGHLIQGDRYYYKVVIEYFDNEKILEYITTNSDNHIQMETEPVVSLEPNDALTSYNRIAGTIYLTDKSCLLNSNDNNDDCSVTRDAYVQIINDPTGDSEDENAIVTTKNIKFIPGEDGRLQATIDVGGLEENTFYAIRVKANRTDMQNSGAVTIEYSDDSARGIFTKSLSTFYIDWLDEAGSRENVVNVTGRFISDNIGDMSREESAQAIKRVEISLYEGKINTETIENGNLNPIVAPVIKSYSTGTNIKNEFYDNRYNINSGSTFELSYDTLASKSTDGKIQQYYTIYINAYYDEQGTKKIELSNKSYSYRVDDALLREDIGEMGIEVTKILNGSGDRYPNLHSENTVIGYNVHTEWETNKLLSAHFEPKKIRIYVIDKNNPNKEVKFYVEGKEGLQDYIYEDIGISTFKDVKIFMDYGSENEDNVMRRGHDYYIGFEIEAMTTSDNSGRISHLPFNSPEDHAPRANGKFYAVGEKKELPQFKMYLKKSTATDVTYWYEIDDPDYYLYHETPESDYEIYYDINSIENILTITEDKISNINHNAFTGTFNISNLNKGDYYAIYAKLSDKDTDILKYPNITENTQRLFEGEYQATDYNFNFDIINNELTNNQVKIKILADNELLSRIVNYKVTFTTKNANQEIDKTQSFNFGKLSSCGDGGETNRCLIVDYDELRKANMKSSASTLKEIYTSVEIMYDNGLAGYDYNVGGSNENDPPYMIMQGNNTKAALGKYAVFTNGTERNGKMTYAIRIWNETDFNHKGYYRYSWKDDTTIQYTSYYAKSTSPSGSKTTYDFPSFTIDNYDGRKVTIDGETITLNPKMLVTATKDCEGNTFHFSSYTPTIDIKNEVPMINGETLTIALSGASANELCEENEGSNCVNRGENGTYKMYIDVWDNLDDIGDKDKIVRPTSEVLIDATNPNKEYTTQILGLKDTSTYYFRVYAWLNKNNTKHLTQLFDTTESARNDGFKTKNYPLSTWGQENIFLGINISSVLSDASNASYGARVLDTKIEIAGYTNASVKRNYNVTYVICDATATIQECNPESDSNLKLLTNTITSTTLQKENHDKLAIDGNFEHDKDYKAFAYALYEYYDNYAETKSATTTTASLLLGGGNRHVNELKKPKFNNIDREAILIGPNEYAIDITPHVEDESQVLTEGKYYVKLLSGSSVVGTMQVMENGSYVTKGTGDEYLEHYFYIYDPNTQTQAVRFTGLNADTVYSVVVYGEANVNNYNPDIPIAERKKIYQTDPPITVYSTDPSGVAFGEVSFTATKNSIILTFLGGSNINNVEKVEYTIGNWANYNADREDFYDETLTYHDIYLTSEHGFGHNANNDPQYTISPPGMDNTPGIGNPSIIKFYLIGESEPIKYVGAPVYKPD